MSVVASQTPKEAGKYPDGTYNVNPVPHPAFAKVEIVDADAGLVEVIPKRKKMAIVGFASSTRDKAPFDDPDWLIVGLNQLYRYLPRFDLWFEIHNRAMFLADAVRDSNYLGWLQSSPVPVIMCERQPDIPLSVRYPIERAIALTGRDYFTSSPAFMVAYALLEGFEEVAIYGIDLIVGQEYDYQKACMEYWLGVATARGVKVTVPKESALLKSLSRYGYETEPKFWPLSLSQLKKERAELASKREHCITTLNNLDGALQILDHHLNCYDVVMKGGTIPESS